MGQTDRFGVSAQCMYTYELLSTLDDHIREELLEHTLKHS